MVDYKLFDRKFPRLKKEMYSAFHSILEKSNRDDISWKCDRCGIDGIRLDCIENHEHVKYVSCNCKKRTCPQCSMVLLGKSFYKYRKIQEIFTDVRDHPEKYPSGFAFRFWTFTIKAEKYKPLRKKFITMRKSIDRWWMYTYGKRSPYKSSHAGGVFVFEVQSGWNVHIHAIILGQFLDVDFARNIWIESVKYYGDYSCWMHVVKIDDASDKLILELLCYPLHPDKEGKFDQELMAQIELAMSMNKNADSGEYTSPIRRMFEKGSFYQRFTLQQNMALCPICAEHGFIAEMYHENLFDRIFGRRHKTELFVENDEGLRNYLTMAYKYPDVQRLVPALDIDKFIPAKETII
ncbi:hypothetical protein ES702_05903 [subsurface metagenome]